MRRVIAWTGGSVPPRGYRTPHVRELFREQVGAWCDAWGPRITLDVCRIFYKRARYDAWSTSREESEHV